MISSSILFGLALGIAVGAGKYKTWAFLLVPAILCIFKIFPHRLKFWLLALSIPMSLLQMPSLPLPYGTQVSEAILIFLTLDEILFLRHDIKHKGKSLTILMVILMGLFSLAGLISNLGGDNIHIWNVYCLQPLIIFFLISRKIHNWDDAWLLVRLSLLTIVGFIVIVELAIVTGQYFSFDPLATMTTDRLSRIADGIIIDLGPIQYTLFATRMGAIAALGLPTCLLMGLKSKEKTWMRIVLLVIIAVLAYILILSATRGAVVAAIAGSFLAVLISGRFRSPLFVAALGLSLVVLSLWGETILKMFPSYNIQRILTLTQGVQSIGNFHQRLDALSFAWDLTLNNPLGTGFGDIYHLYQVDDAIIYAVILQGTGILGAFVFILIVGVLAFNLGFGALKLRIGLFRDLASVGLSTLATGLLAGISSLSYYLDFYGIHQRGILPPLT